MSEWLLKPVWDLNLCAACYDQLTQDPLSEWLLKPVWDLNRARRESIVVLLPSEWLLKPVWDLNMSSNQLHFTYALVGMAAQARLGFKQPVIDRHLQF